MWSKLKQFLAPPSYKDAEKSLVTSLLNTILLIFVGFAILINVVLPCIKPGANYATSLIFLGVVLMLFAYIRYGGYRAVQVSSVVLCLALWVILTLNGWADEGLRNMASISYFALTIAAGLLMGGKGAIVFGLLSIAGAFIIYYGETLGMVKVESRGVDFSDWVKFTFIEITVMLLIRYAVQHLTQALDRLRMSERLLVERAEELSKANRQLRILGEAKNEFIANVSHELRSPITNLNMYEDLLDRRPDRLEQYLPILRR